mgnify:CR=1 FL=1
MKDDSRLLLILVDGLPYYKVSSDLAPFLASVRVRGPLEPGLGFSINIYPELFAGRQPDDLGYFNKWGLKRAEDFAQPRRIARLLAGVADVSRVSQLASRALHKLWEGAIGEKNLANIPFQLLPFYARNPSEEVLETDAYPTVFSIWGTRLLLSYKFPGRLGEKDNRTVEEALRAMGSGASLFVLLGDLDGIAHVHGLDARFDAHLRRLDVWVEELVRAFRQRHGSAAHVVVVSDHGMARTDPSKAVSLRLQRRFGHIRYDTYVPFWDALMLRIWVQDQGLLSDMLDYVSGFEFGRVLSEEDRQYFGVTKREFGDIIFLLKEGFAFYPSFFGARFPKALHGYDPKLDSQQAFFGYLGPSTLRPPHRAVEVFSLFQELARPV